MLIPREDGRQEQAYNRAASGLVHTHQPRGVLYFIDQIGAPPCFIATRKLSQIHSSLTRKVESSQFTHDMTHHKDYLAIRIPSSRWLKILASYASAKLAGLRALGCGGLTTKQPTHTQHNINGGGRSYPVYPTSTCSLVFLLELMLWQAFSWKSSLPSQGFLVQQNKRNTHTLTCPSTMSSFI